MTAEKDGDVAYVGSDWNEGISPWDFGTGVNLREREPLLRGSVFTDRGVYRLGEEVHFKAILRHNTPAGVRLLPEGTPVLMTVRDAQNRARGRARRPRDAVEQRRVDDDAAAGRRARQLLAARDPRERPAEAADARRPRGPATRPARSDDDYVPYEKAVHGSFLVAAYRRPDFRVDVTLTGDERRSPAIR